jgi:hypothetical protein
MIADRRKKLVSFKVNNRHVRLMMWKSRARGSRLLHNGARKIKSRIEPRGAASTGPDAVRSLHAPSLPICSHWVPRQTACYLVIRLRIWINVAVRQKIAHILTPKLQLIHSKKKKKLGFFKIVRTNGELLFTAFLHCSNNRNYCWQHDKKNI